MSSKSEHYVHFVWATKNREPLITSDIERNVHRCLAKEVERLKCHVCALDGMPDHVHLLVALHPDVCASRLMKQIKGISSAAMNDMSNHQRRFRWQEGYYVRSVSLSHLKFVIAYVENQKQHHSEATVRTEWEDCGDE